MSEIIALNTNTVEVFNNSNFGQVRTSRDEQGVLWFCLADIGKVLDLSESTTRMMKNRNWFDNDEIVSVTNCDGGSDLIYVSESALFRILNRSNSPKARPFERWVTKEVLPSIRKTGYYSIVKTPLERILQNSNNQLETAKAITEMLEIEDRKHKEELAIEKGVTKRVFDALNIVKEDYLGLYHSFVGTEKWDDMREVAAKLHIRGLGRNKLFQLLRDEGVLDRNNIPFREYIDRGYFMLSETVRTTKNGDMKFNKVMVSQSGKVFIEKLARRV